MPFNSNITRTDAGALIPEEVSREIIQGTVEQSAVLRLGRRLPNMARNQLRMPVLSALPTAYFVNPADVGLKETTEMAWDNKYVNVEEIAVIVPIPEAVLADADYDIWGEVKPRLTEAFGVVVDAAVIHGTNAPATWPTNIVAGAALAGNSAAVGGFADLYDAILSDTGILSLLEADGFVSNGHVAATSMRARLRGVRDADGQPIFRTGMTGPTAYSLDGDPIIFPRNGALNAALALLISGDWSQLVYSFRQDITWKVLDQAVINDAGGNIIYNLAQQDMVALRGVMRLGWQLPNPINRMQPVEASRYPFAVLTP